MGYQTILLDISDGVAVLKLNRPDHLNSVTHEMRTEMFRALDELEKNENVAILVFTGAGRAFCAGQDIDELKRSKSNPVLKQAANDLMFRLPKRIYQFSKPTIGAINGTAVGDGAQWVLAFDLNVASEEAKFGWIATSLGLVCPYGLSRLPEEVGRNRAKELLMTKKLLSAREAHQWGLVTRVVPHGELMQSALELAGEIKNMPQLSVLAIKSAVNKGTGSYDNACEILVALQNTEDAKEGIASFLEKRKPEFKGR